MRENKVQKRATREREESRKYHVIETKITISLKRKEILKSQMVQLSSGELYIIKQRRILVMFKREVSM